MGMERKCARGKLAYGKVKIPLTPLLSKGEVRRGFRWDD
jgi:hypothetical protein